MPLAETGAPTADLVVLIPAYRPGPALVSVVTELARAGFTAIVVIDDGSEPVYSCIFTSVSEIGSVSVLRHPENLGKGAALKTGIAHALRTFPGLVGVVTADADGQHSPGDIRSVGSVFRHSPDSLILGSRQFEGTVPVRSRLGNAVTRLVVRFLVGQKLRDTQTGLRAIPRHFAASLLELTSSGYEFELDMLIAARANSIAVVEKPIQTIYAPRNESSHFNPIVDSMKIYFVLARFCSVALITALIDNAVFSIVYPYSASLAAAQMVARGAALAFNYPMVRDKVFHASGRQPHALARYLFLVMGSGITSYACIRLATNYTQITVLFAKLAVESVLFFVNFIVERDWVFAGQRDAGSSNAH